METMGEDAGVRKIPLIERSWWGDFRRFIIAYFGVIKDASTR
jgi:hypothetical protein